MLRSIGTLAFQETRTTNKKRRFWLPVISMTMSSKTCRELVGKRVVAFMLEVGADLGDIHGEVRPGAGADGPRSRDRCPPVGGRRQAGCWWIRALSASAQPGSGVVERAIALVQVQKFEMELCVSKREQSGRFPRQVLLLAGRRRALRTHDG